MPLIITDAGLAASTNKDGTGLSPVTLTEVQVYDSGTRKTVISLQGVDLIEPARIYTVAEDASNASYNARELRFYTDTGVWFATAKNSDNSIIQSKSASSVFMLALELDISQAPGSVAPSGNISFLSPYATEDARGSIEIANQSEAGDKDNDTRALTPKKFWSVLSDLDATEANKGLVELASLAEAENSAVDNRALTPKNLWNVLSTLNATENDKGLARIATLSEARAPENTQLIITPNTLWEILSGFVSKIDARAVGELGWFTTTILPRGFIELKGQRITGGVAKYPALADSGSRFITRSGNDLIMADARDFIRGKGSSDRTVGAFESDAIRNITGRINLDDRDGNRICDGAFQRGSWISGTAGAEGGDSGSVINHFDASRVVPTASENRPKSLTALVAIYAGV